MMNQHDIANTAAAMVGPGKGILAADESTATIGKRFAAIGVPCNEDTRRAYRELMFTTLSLERYISGVILYDETLRQCSADGTPLPRLLAERGILPGIKVDTGARDLAGFAGETVTEGLDGLRQRLQEYVELGARFAKWRAVIHIDASAGRPTQAALAANAHGLARYAGLCQEAGLVPIVEPEVLMDGAHDLAACEAATVAVLTQVFADLRRFHIDLTGIVLKPNMVLSGTGHAAPADVAQVAHATVRTFRRIVPEEVPGIAFLSGGQSPQQATAHLQAMNSLGSLPWELTFSYGRALQEPVLQAWQGAAGNVEVAQQALLLRARLNAAARAGTYDAQMEAAQLEDGAGA